MRSTGPYLFALIGLIALSGCASMLEGFRNPVVSPAELYRQRALAYESADEPQKALFYWGIAAHLDKKNVEIPKAMLALQSASAKAAQVHFERGLGQYRSGDLNNAMREFLITLRLNPDHAQASDYLKHRLQNPEQTTYRVQPGDSFTRITDNIYKDPSKADLLAYFNGMDPKKPLLIGTDLRIPAFGDELIIPRLDIRSLLEKARRAYDNKQYTQVYALTDTINKAIPDHPKAREIADTAHFDQGMALMNQKHYLAAIEQFKLVSAKYKGRDDAIARARGRISKQAIKEKLKAARELLGNKEWAGVINASEEILAQDPNNDEAKMLFSNASYKMGKFLLERGQTAESIEILSRIEPSYEDTGQLLSLGRARMKSQAETLYRDGVKHFINEDLENAIKTWKQVLEINPDHPKARQNMENAERLLEKLEALDKEPIKAKE